MTGGQSIATQIILKPLASIKLTSIDFDVEQLHNEPYPVSANASRGFPFWVTVDCHLSPLTLKATTTMTRCIQFYFMIIESVYTEYGSLLANHLQLRAIACKYLFDVVK